MSSSTVVFLTITAMGQIPAFHRMYFLLLIKQLDISKPKYIHARCMRIFDNVNSLLLVQNNFMNKRLKVKSSDCKSVVMS